MIFIIVDLTNHTNILPCIDDFLDKHNLKGSMAGDINIFLNRDSDNPQQGELSVMICEKSS